MLRWDMVVGRTQLTMDLQWQLQMGSRTFGKGGAAFILLSVAAYPCMLLAVWFMLLGLAMLLLSWRYWWDKAGQYEVR